MSAGKFQFATPLPPRPDDLPATVTISGKRARSRRTSTRLSSDARRQQIVQAAGKIMLREGMHAASLKRIAREIGLSGAQIYNHFGSQEELLVSMARQELKEMNITQHAQIIRGADHICRITLWTVTSAANRPPRSAVAHSPG